METLLTWTGIALTSFLIGSFPTAYLLIRKRSGRDLRQEGSGNIGTLNAYEVSRSRALGASVLLIDLAKGALPVAVVHLAGDAITADSRLMAAAVAMLSAVIGHNYSPWIGWKGGRGLATAAGASLLINPVIVLLWGTFWAAGFFRTRKVHFGNIAATVLMPFAVWIASSTVNAATFFPTESDGEIVLVSFALAVLVLLRHIEPLRQLLKRT